MKLLRFQHLRDTGIKEAAEKAVKLAESKKLSTIASQVCTMRLRHAISEVEDKLGQ